MVLHSKIHFDLSTRLANEFKKCENVIAIAIGGSVANKKLDVLSDVDLYVYTGDYVPLSVRENICKMTGGNSANLGLSFWDPSDEWIDSHSGILVDIMYWHTEWIENAVKRVIEKHEASTGYTSCLWHTVKNSICLFDRNGWFKQLQEECAQDYPEKLKDAIIAKNYPILNSIHSSYYDQIKKAIARNDFISINHRISEFLASYFDILFAVNYLTHPGEKRVLQYALNTCRYLPVDLETNIIILLTRMRDSEDTLLPVLQHLIVDLDKLLQDLGIVIKKSV